jgi:hypothetical protein
MMTIKEVRSVGARFAEAIARELQSIRPGARLSRVLAHVSDLSPPGSIDCICEFSNGQRLLFVTSLAGETFNAWLKEQIEARVAALVVMGLVFRVGPGRGAV